MAQTLISSGWFSFELRVTVPVHELVSFTRMSLDAKKDGAQCSGMRTALDASGCKSDV